MKNSWQAERGVAAIEMTIVLTLGIFVLAAVTLVGRLTWHAIAMQKAVSSAGRIVSALPFETLTIGSAAMPLFTLVNDHVRATTISAGLDLQPDWVVVNCMAGLPGGCGRAAATQVGVGATVRFRDSIFDASATGLSDLTDLDLPLTYYQTYVP